MVEVGSQHFPRAELLGPTAAHEAQDGGVGQLGDDVERVREAELVVELPVDEDDVGAGLERLLDRLEGVARVGHDEPPRPEARGEGPEGVHVRVHQENSPRHRPSRGRLARLHASSPYRATTAARLAAGRLVSAVRRLSSMYRAGMEAGALRDPVCETARLILRRLSADDGAFILELLNEPSFIQNIGDRGVRTLDDARRYIQNGPVASYARLGFGLYLVALRRRRCPSASAGS